ncbi:MAG TPA: ABC transporter substrate-binding protein [Acidimicrobiales bacterium]
MTRGKRIGALAGLVALALVAAACGDDSGSSDNTTTSTGEATTTSASAPGTTAPFADPLKYDESAKCGTADYKGSIAKLEAVDALTVKFTLCAPDVAFPSKVAFSAFQIHPKEYIDSTGGKGDLVEKPIGTGPYKLKAWERGSQIVLERNDGYWGDKALSKTVVFKWQKEAAQRLVELKSGAADGIDNLGPADFDAVRADSSLQLVERAPLNVFYLGMNRDAAPFDKEEVRQAIGYALNKKRIVDNFYPKGSVTATQFLPSAIPGYVDGFTDFTNDEAKAKDLLTKAGYPNGFDIKLSYRDVVRGYLPQPNEVAQDIQNQLAKVGIRVTLDVQESGTFIDNANAGKVPFHMLGWGADYPDATNFLDYHFGAGASPQFGTGFEDIQKVLKEAASLSVQADRDKLYEQAAKLIAQHAPMIPVAHGGSGLAYKKDVKGAHASPLSNEQMSVMGIDGQDQFVFIQNGEPSGLYCADETDGEALRVCEQINESLLGYKVGGTDTVPALAEKYTASSDLKEWTFTLRSGVKFHDGSDLDANDVVRSFRVQWDAKDPAHTGRTGDFTYFSALFGGFLNPPPAKG